jgi:hypothetical protein
MSGGSFNYLCWNSYGEIVECRNDLERMLDFMQDTYPFAEATRDTEEVCELIRHFFKEIDRRVRPLQHVWHDIEWWQSCDYSKDKADKAISLYEADKLKAREQ